MRVSLDKLVIEIPDKPVSSLEYKGIVTNKYFVLAKHNTHTISYLEINHSINKIENINNSFAVIDFLFTHRKYRGNGIIGLLIKKSHEKYLPIFNTCLQSDGHVSQKAKRVWEKLEKEKLARKFRYETNLGTTKYTWHTV